MDISSQFSRLVRVDGREIPIDHELTIGRLADCNIQIEDSLISRKHARLEISGNQVILSDLGSHNGTWVNDKKIDRPTSLANGDKVRIGRSIFVFKAAPVLPASPVLPISPTSPVTTDVVVNVPAPEAVKQESGTMIWEMAAPLTLVRGDGAEFGLNSDSTVGRDAGNSIPLEKDTSASQFHARLDLDQGRIIATDLGSANGTWVNGKRITAPVLLKHGDRIRVGNTLFRLRVGDNPLPPVDAASQPVRDSGKSVRTSVGISLGATILIIFCLGMIALGVWGIPKLLAPEPSATRTARATNTSVVISGDPGSEATRAAMGREVALRSLVWVIVPDADTERTGMVSTGSGSLLDADGYVLTNDHVIAENIGEFLVGLNWSDPTGEPNTFYQCELVSRSSALDLAVLHIIALESGAPLPPDLVFPYLPVGDSDSVHIGDSVIIIGFPGIGGNTPTLTSGTVSGFSPDTYNDLDNGWLKTDALISWGNSGGMAINLAGELIGVPTQFTEESMEERPLDTFLGLLRPINLALPLIREFLP